MFGLITIINIQDIDINKLIDRENRIRNINKPQKYPNIIVIKKGILTSEKKNDST